jgi:thermitase
MDRMQRRRRTVPGRRLALALVGMVETVVLIISPLAWAPLFSAGSLGASATAQEHAQKAADVRLAAANRGISPNRIVIVYGRGVGRNDARRLNARHAGGGELLLADAKVSRDVVRIGGSNAAAVAARIRRLPGVRDAYTDRLSSITLSVNDPLMGREWGLSKIKASTAWDTTEGNGVKVAVLDCGMHASHPDLAGKVVLEQNLSSSSTTDDLCNHGTHVSGTIGAVTNNGTGVAAVAPGVSLLNGKVLGDNGSGFFSDIDTGIEWAADNGAKVISMSLGGSGPCPSGTQAAANYAWGKGVVLVAAAGNNGGSGALAPANCQNVIGVAATDKNDRIASFSNFGPEVDVAAPGVNIDSTVNPSLNGGKLYDYFSGTSMATPHTAAVVALIWSVSSGASPAYVRDRLFTTADHITGTGSLFTYGRIDAAAAVTGGSPPPSPGPATLSATVRAGAVRLSWSSSPGSLSYTVYRGGVSGPKLPIAAGVLRTRFTDRSAVVVQTFCYVVTATSAGGESGPSPEVCVVVR